MNLLKTSRETLLKPLQAVAGIIERRHTLPILSNVLLAGEGGRLAFIATDIEIEISAAAAAEAQGADGKSLTARSATSSHTKASSRISRPATTSFSGRS